MSIKKSKQNHVQRIPHCLCGCFSGSAEVRAARSAQHPVGISRLSVFPASSPFWCDSGGIFGERKQPSGGGPPGFDRLLQVSVPIYSLQSERSAACRRLAAKAGPPRQPRFQWLAGILFHVTLNLLQRNERVLLSPNGGGSGAAERGSEAELVS